MRIHLANLFTDVVYDVVKSCVFLNWIVQAERFSRVVGYSYFAIIVQKHRIDKLEHKFPEEKAI